MNTKQKDLLSTQENVENSHNENSTLADKEPIPGTPFIIRRLKDNWFMTMGDYIVTEYTKTREEQIEKLESEKWLLIMHICIIAVQKIQQETELFNKQVKEHELQKSKESYDKATDNPTYL